MDCQLSFAVGGVSAMYAVSYDCTGEFAFNCIREEEGVYKKLLFYLSLESLNDFLK